MCRAITPWASTMAQTAGCVGWVFLVGVQGGRWPNAFCFAVHCASMPSTGSPFKNALHTLQLMGSCLPCSSRWSMPTMALSSTAPTL